jgi:hypothetical protein|tara:strand:+ start:351 stop:524 length:174 start_codon:yes stop_codon:yes gene_type:complete
MSIAEFQEEYFNFLVDLRDSGVTNMWGAGPYLEDEFNLTKQEAKDVLLAWIKSFEEK